MKWIISFCLLTTLTSFSQFSVESHFNRNATSNNQTLTLNYQLNKWKFGAGVKYLYKKRDNFPRGVYFKRTFWALNTIEHFGAEAYAMYNIWQLERAAFDVFYDFQFTKSVVRFDSAYELETTYFSPVYGFENNIGINFTFNLTEKLFLSQKAGAGILIYNLNDPDANGVNGVDWVFSEMLSIGLGYRFGAN